MSEKVSAEYFGVGDVIVFAGTLVLSGLIGVYFAVKDRKLKNVENYYYGGKEMNPIALGISISVTFISALTVIGLPTETYVFGVVSGWYAFALVVPTLFACLYYIPLMHGLQLNTLYEYLELRFHPIVRQIISGTEVISMLVYMGVTVYVPALALNAVTPISMQWSILLTSGICTLYTTFGGMKAVVWTDVAQAAIMFIGALAALVKTAMVIGGLENAMLAVDRGGRNNFFDMNPDPTRRSTFWTMSIGLSISYSVLACANQSIYQRYLACKSINGARVASISAIFPKIVLTAISILSGCVAYAYFEGCDPLKTGKISKKDQLMPYLVLIVFRETPGMAGFFVAAAYSGTMSTVSSGINALSAQLLEDFVLVKRPNLGHASKLIIGKLSVFALGLTVTALAYAASLLTGTILSLVMTVRGALGGPILGIYTLGLFFPWANAKGAIVGHFTSSVLMIWIGIGGLLGGRSPESQGVLPTSVDGCSNSNATNLTSQSSFNVYDNNSFTLLGQKIVRMACASYIPILILLLYNTVNESPDTVEPPGEPYYNPIYSLSLMYTCLIGFTLTIVIGLTVSFLTGANDPKHLDPKLFTPILDNKIFPEKVREFFRFGVPLHGETITRKKDGFVYDEKSSIEDDKQSEIENILLTNNQKEDGLHLD